MGRNSWGALLAKFWQSLILFFVILQSTPVISSHFCFLMNYAITTKIKLSIVFGKLEDLEAEAASRRDSYKKRLDAVKGRLRSLMEEKRAAQKADKPTEEIDSQLAEVQIEMKRFLQGHIDYTIKFLQRRIAILEEVESFEKLTVRVSDVTGDLVEVTPKEALKISYGDLNAFQQ